MSFLASRRGKADDFAHRREKAQHLNMFLKPQLQTLQRGCKKGDMMESSLEALTLQPFPEELPSIFTSSY